MNTDILIVGAGPTGLMLANQLQRRGVRIVIIDQHSGPAQQTRAMAVHARTLEIYSKLGLASRALDLGRRGNGANIWAKGQLRARLPLSDIGTNESPYPYVLMLGQDDNERMMGEALRQAGVSIGWQTKLVGLVQGDEQVTATVRQADGSTREITAAYVAGCDGAHSAVRELNGIGFPGAPYEQEFFVADTEAVGNMVPEELNVYLWSGGFHLFFPMRGTNRWRMIGMMPIGLQGIKDLRFMDVVPAIADQAGSGVIFNSCSWFSTYKLHHRRTEAFSKGRCFLLGDAAHVHSPMGGQGMNTGLQDAYNLAWKLALVVDGRASAELLDSYGAEREPVAQHLLDTTDRAFRVIIADNWLAALFRTSILARVAAFAMRKRRVRRQAFYTISQLGIRYRLSPIARTLKGMPAKSPQAGDRFPWMQLQFEGEAQAQDVFQRFDDTCFNLVLIGQKGPADSEIAELGLTQVHRATSDSANAGPLATVGIESQAFFLIRPDGHIGLAGAHYDHGAVMQWFQDCHIQLGAEPELDSQLQSTHRTSPSAALG